ncbi:hypothetical protein NUM3379_25830 [Kineococcus sp. NUM-3379]
MPEQDDRSDVIDRWCRAGEAGDVDAAASCLAPDVEFVSPLTARLRFTGRGEVRDLLAAAFGALEGLRFHTRLDGSSPDGSTHALFARARVGGQDLEEAQLLRLDGAGLVREITVFGRPLPALTALMSTLGPRLARGQGRPGLAAVLTAATLPLHTGVLLGDRRVVPLTAPR